MDLDFLSGHEITKRLVRRQFCHGQLDVLGGDGLNKRLVLRSAFAGDRRNGRLDLGEQLGQVAQFDLIDRTLNRPAI